MSRHTVLLVLSLLLALPASARREKLALRTETLELPGAPAAVVAADVDGDGLRDLAVVIAFTRWGEIGVEESVKMDDVEGLVEVLSVIPSLIDRRELRVFLGRPGGGFDPAARSMPIEPSVLSLEAGPPGAPVVALTDEGLSALRLRGAELSFEPLVQERPVLAGTGTFLPNLGLVKDLDGDGRADVLLPTAAGASVYLSGPEGFRLASRLLFPLDDLQGSARGNLSRFHPLPEVRDVDGNRLPDLVLRHASGEWSGFRVLRNQGGGRFSEAVAPLGKFQEKQKKQEKKAESPAVVYFGDLDGDGRAEYITQEERGPGEDAGMREEMKHAKRPKFFYRVHRARPDLGLEPKPYQQFEAEGYAFDTGGGGGDGENGAEIRLPGGHEDLNGDGRTDLIALTLDFSMLQAVKVLAVQRISIGIDFHVQCQGPDGRFAPVRGLDLSGKFNLNLNNMKIGHISQFAGDFDGDGRADFTQMGRGKTVTIHRGRADCSYPAQPDLTLQLREAPRDLALVQVRDLDGDALTDLLVIQPQPVKEVNVTPPVRLDLYLSRGEG